MISTFVHWIEIFCWLENACTYRRNMWFANDLKIRTKTKWIHNHHVTNDAEGYILTSFVRIFPTHPLSTI